MADWAKVEGLRTISQPFSGNTALLGTEAEFGGKAAGLVQSARERATGTQIAPGFMISKALVAQIASGTATPAQLDGVRSAFEDLIDSIGRKSVIVRSSSSLEQLNGHSFSGVFRTVADVTSYSELVSAIAECFASGHSDFVRAYCTLHRIELPSEHVAVLVQEQLSFGWSALVSLSARERLIEIFDREFSKKISGRGRPKYAFEYTNSEWRQMHPASPAKGKALQFLSCIRNLIDEIAESDVLGSADNTELLLELCYDGSHIHILQSDLQKRTAFVSRKPPEDLNDTPVGRAADALGLKGAALSYFQRAGLFESEARVFPPSTSLEEMAHVVRLLPSKTGYTVRFSRHFEMGLPRAFFETVEQALYWIAKHRKNGWTTIVHPFLDVARSFELLLGTNTLLLEHVPGMWESDNTLEPDVLEVTQHGAKYWRYNCSRTARFDYATGSAVDRTSPVAVSRLEVWLKRLEPVAEILRRDFGRSLPLNFHFVENGEGKWSFLNVRRGDALDYATVHLSISPYVVSTPADVDRWDRVTPILIRFSTSRGNERSVLEIARKLPIDDPNFVLIVDFGLLSHPAILLRELGVRVVPSYMCKGSKDSAYEEGHFQLDVGDSALRRIRKEPAVYSGQGMHAVADRSPITPGHLLVIAEESVPSFADVESLLTLDSFLFNAATDMVGPWIFLERGRAAFCTSGFGSSHAHGHLLPANAYPADILERFCSSLNAVHYSTLIEALRVARSQTREYILAARAQGDAYLYLVPEGARVEKQLIRRFFTAVNV